MKIPSEFQCMGMTIDVQMGDLEQVEAHGTYQHSKNLITIDKSQSAQGKESTFFHELVHCILETLGYDEQSKDERFVEQFAQCLYQFHKSKK